MALAFTLVDSWDDGRRIHVAGNIAFTGNYSSGGDTLDLSGIGAESVPTTQPPIVGTVRLDGLAGYDYVFVPGAAINSAKVRIFENAGAAGAFAEVAAGAYPAAIAADTVTFYGIFPKLQ